MNRKYFILSKKPNRYTLKRFYIRIKHTVQYHQYSLWDNFGWIYYRFYSVLGKNIATICFCFIRKNFNEKKNPVSLFVKRKKF